MMRKKMFKMDRIRTVRSSQGKIKFKVIKTMRLPPSLPPQEKSDPPPCSLLVPTRARLSWSLVAAAVAAVVEAVVGRARRRGKSVAST